MRHISSQLQLVSREAAVPHEAPITAVDWAPDGLRLATGSYDGTVNVWVDNGATVRMTLPHLRLVNAVRWSRSGQWLASGSADKACFVWEADGGALRSALVRHSDDVNALAWAPGDTRIATVSEDTTGRIWDMASGVLLNRVLPHRNHCMSVDWNGSSDVIATCGEDNEVIVWDRDGVALESLPHPSGLEMCRWSRDGLLLATACDDGYARIYDRGSRCIATLGPHEAPVKSVSFSPDARLLAVGTYDSRCTVWDVASASRRGVFSGPRLWPRALDWNPRNALIAVGTFDARPIVLDTAQLTGAREAVSVPVGPPTFGINAVSVVPGRGVLLGCDDGVVRLWRLGSDASVGAVPLQSASGSLVNSVAAQGSFLATGRFDGSVQLHDLASGRCVSTFETGAPVNQVSWSPNQRSISVADYEGRLTILTIAADGTLRMERRVEAHEGAIKSALWFDDQTLVTASTDRTVKLIARTGDVLQTFQGHANLVNWVDVTTPDAPRRLIASASRDHTVRIWDPASGRCERVLMGHDESVKVVRWKPRSDTIVASGSYDFDVRVWDLASPRRESALLTAHRNGISALAWWNDQLISAAWDTAVVLWPRDLQNATPERSVTLSSLR